MTYEAPHPRPAPRLRTLVLCLLGIGAACAGVVSAGGPDERSVLPGPPEAENPTVSEPQRGRLAIVALDAGRPPIYWLEPGRWASSFVTDSDERLSVRAKAEVIDEEIDPGDVVWEIEPPAWFLVPGGVELRGPILNVTLERSGGNPDGGGEPLALRVTARAYRSDRSLSDSAALAQDLLDRLRQEYVDLRRRVVPPREAFLDEREFAALYGSRFPSVEFRELNYSGRPGTGERYPFVLATEELVAALHGIEAVYGMPLTFSSGYRNPVRQLQVHASVPESHHQYGRAADLYVRPDSALPRTGRHVAWPADWLRLAAASVRGGGAWIEPMTACHVNTDGCHVHVDVRPSGPRSAVVQVSGSVADAGGRPAAGATVRLAGMPAVTNADGRFHLKHVLTPRRYALEVEAAGHPFVAEEVEIAGDRLETHVRLPAPDEARLTGRFDEASPSRDERQVLVRLRNAGGGAARDLEVRMLDDDGLPQEPAVKLATLGAGQETTVRLERPALGAGEDGPEASLRLRLRVFFRDGAGREREQVVIVQRSDESELPQPRAPAAPQPPAEPLRSEPSETPLSNGAAGAGGAALGAAAAIVTRALARGTAARGGGEPSADVAQARGSDDAHA